MEYCCTAERSLARNHQLNSETKRRDSAAMTLLTNEAVRAAWAGTRHDRQNRVRNSMIEHRAIAHAILAGEEDAADRAMGMHISSGGNVFDVGNVEVHRFTGVVGVADRERWVGRPFMRFSVLLN